MTDRPVRQPTADHPITVEPTGKHVTVRVNGEVVAETDDCADAAGVDVSRRAVHPVARRRRRAC